MCSCVGNLSRILGRLSIICLLAPISAQAPIWTQVKPVTSPSVQGFDALAYDAARRQVVLFSSNGLTSATTWLWNGRSWIQAKSAQSPRPRALPSMAYDAVRKQVVLFGGAPGYKDTWLWNGKTWTQAKPATSPPQFLSHSMAYDSARRQVVLFGITVKSATDTWLWDGKTWTLAKPVTSPSARVGHAMTYDAARRQVVLFGGTSGGSETWLWNGNTWTQAKPTVSPSVRASHAMAYDAARQQVVLFGGLTPVSPRVSLNDTWTWDGKAWTQAKPLSSPSARHFHAMAYDAVRRRIVLFGGRTHSGPSNETWEFYVPPLTSSSGSLSVSAGGTVQFWFQTPLAHARKIYLILGSMAGTSPGIRLGALTLPLNPDSYFAYTASDPGGLIQGSLGILDLQGRGSAKLVLPPRLGTPFLGRTMHHACLVLWAGPRFDFVSNAVPLKLVK